MQVKKLIFVDPNANHNKFYNMVQTDANGFEVTFGRVGTDGRKQRYPMSKWSEQLRAKLRKGYQDVTVDDTIVKVGTNFDDSTISPKVKDLIDLLNKHAKEAFKLNYKVEISDVSVTLIKRAQDLIDQMNEKLEVGVKASQINPLLLRLYSTISRKMKSVKEAMMPDIDDATTLSKARDKMAVEQGLLDVVKGQLQNYTDNKSDDDDVDDAIDNSKVLTVLDHLGVDIEEISATEETMLKKMMNESEHRYIEAFKVTNFKTQKTFDKEITNSKDKKTELLFHGSRAENWLNIIRGGLVLHPNAVVTGKLYDNGIYFADVADKALGYIDGGRWNNGAGNDNWMAVYEVHLGKQATSDDLPNSRVDLSKWIPDNGYDSYFARKGKDSRYNLYRNEFIVYKESKCTIKYLIKVK